jgi:uncharacterized protein YyaL (SSP411 family)
LDIKNLEVALKYFDQKFDAQEGGFGPEPKFPTPVNLDFLIQMSHLRTEAINEQDRAKAKEMVRYTLEKMSLGGIHGRSYLNWLMSRSHRARIRKI